MRSIVAASLLLAMGVAAQSPAWGQCGGIGWSGATTCVSGYCCKVTNEFYSQCVPGDCGGSPTTGPSTTGPSSPVPTLQPGYSFIRAVTDPNFHKYLRSEVQWTASGAILGEPNDAAQFQITNGQLIQNANGTPLYATPATSSADGKKLALSWSKTQAGNGSTFVWSGDTVTWSSSAFPRPQNNAWLVCQENSVRRLYLNLGAYGYQTPAGCADHTIHGYTGSTPNA